MRGPTDALRYSEVKVASGIICARRNRIARRAERVRRPPRLSPLFPFMSHSNTRGLNLINPKDFADAWSITLAAILLVP